ncbi:hypothetical protein B0I72DRAFT_135015 [Yarrowia lipolytica]|uniref:YALI0E30767p n=2 Tax=Yarrowia lipolytica TaxID=4952 RepID=Q6C408_YARLI|nr:YALI0E30767p [Yarrowia lipolytica CLIB122]AOW06194.1 hypothetical protein YALI1_E36116g [Yarrowia lipolytica]KAB8285538.1 hypothetical protein BKA91DRAFT_133235 [Yarrowia lipolytica]KAE8175374.1 hypothetical protein BKA90DRAFT_132534 [Yarrowia lipolytica]KAJ8057582.1 hypothetical protein LXG23DRAFT_15997 [Yarrowia lipolytica]QNP99823.1 Hypothetical protein YALI2_E01139g [Yarrowia lipolytica]|eukprot:XP_504604.2 YALI0E30767p [Yarrowia lipolytica CLIB122]
MEQQIQELVVRRIQYIEYVRRVHSGSLYWLNSVHLSRDDIEAMHYDNNAAQHLFCLGASLPHMIVSNTTQQSYLRSFLALMKEFETFSSAETTKHRLSGVGRFFRAKTKNDKSEESSAPVEFTHLTIYRLPFVPDMYETFGSVCAILVDAYSKILELPGKAPDSYEMLLRLDERVKRGVLDAFVKDVDAMSKNVVRDEAMKIESLLVNI